MTKVKDFTAEPDSEVTKEELALYESTLQAQQLEQWVEVESPINLKLRIIESMTKIMALEPYMTASIAGGELTPSTRFNAIHKEAEKLLITTIKSIKLEK